MFNICKTAFSLGHIIPSKYPIYLLALRPQSDRGLYRLLKLMCAYACVCLKHLHIYSVYSFYLFIYIYSFWQFHLLPPFYHYKLLGKFLLALSLSLWLCGPCIIQSLSLCIYQLINLCSILLKKHSIHFYSVENEQLSDVFHSSLWVH